MKTLTAIYQNGTFTLEEPLDLPNGTQVQLNVEAIPETQNTSSLSTWDQKIHLESDQFIRQHSELIKVYKGQYVAMQNGIVIDHDTNKRALTTRVRQTRQNTPILIRLVAENPQREVVIRSPRVERKA